MKKVFQVLILFCPLLALAQDKGVHFEQGLSWQQIQEKAKEENKFIFVDCFATWCAPCKLMDQMVYANDSVANYINNKFISVKVQMDSTKSDNDQVRYWYKDARAIQGQYSINAFPTFLFFTPDGKLVHREAGYKNWPVFISVARNAIDPAKQYYTLLKKYRNGEKDYQNMPYLANTAKQIRDDKIADSIAHDYIYNFLMRPDNAELYTADNLWFITFHVHSPNEKAFNLFYKHGDTIDKIVKQNGFAQSVVADLITRAEVQPILEAAKAGHEPDWIKAYRNIQKRYGLIYADKIILDAKVSWCIGPSEKLAGT